jgi:DNA-binding SARP family transcriptional activator
MVLHNLTGRISQLRQALEPHLKSGADSHYILRVGKGNYCFSAQAPCWLDTEEFQSQVAAARAGRAGRALVRGATRLSGGPRTLPGRLAGRRYL